MFTHSTSKISNEHVNHIVKSILNKRQKTVIEQQQTFIRRNSDENNKRNNYLLDKFTLKKRTNSSKENQMPSTTPKLLSPKKKTSIEILDDDDDDFISLKKRPKVFDKPPLPPKENPVKECIDSIISQIEDNEAVCPICNQILSNFLTIDQRQQHVDRCLEGSQLNHIETKYQKSLLSYGKFSSNIRKITTTTTTRSSFKCQICGISFSAKRTYLSHLKKCSNQNSVQLKHVVNFANKTTTVDETKPTMTINKKKVTGINIKNRIIKMEIPKTEDDEQQQLAIALSASIKTATEPPNAFDILQAASKKIKTIDLLTTPLWNVSMEEKLRLSSTRLSNLCERLITPPANPYKFPPSQLQILFQTNFGTVDWWNITATDPQDEEIPMTQLARLLDDENQ